MAPRRRFAGRVSQRGRIQPVPRVARAWLRSGGEASGRSVQAVEKDVWTERGLYLLGRERGHARMLCHRRRKVDGHRAGGAAALEHAVTRMTGLARVGCRCAAGAVAICCGPVPVPVRMPMPMPMPMPRFKHLPRRLDIGECRMFIQHLGRGSVRHAIRNRDRQLRHAQRHHDSSHSLQGNGDGDKPKQKGPVDPGHALA